MSTGMGGAGDSQPAASRTAEERAEDLMERVVSDGSRLLGKVFGRAREEVEDIVAEARTIHDRSRASHRE